MIFRSFVQAIVQIPDPRYRRVLGLGVACTLLLLVFVYGLALWAVEWLQQEPLHLPGAGEIRSLGDLLHWGSLVMLMVLSMALMVPVASAITAFFLDDIADAVEARHAPHLPVPPRHGLRAAVSETVFYFAVLLVVNVLLLIPYGIYLPAAPLLFYGVNGLLLSREYFHLVAIRRMSPAGARALRRKHRLKIWAAGVLMALPLSVPVINLVVPVLGAATFCHLWHLVMQQERSAELRPGIRPSGGLR